MVVNLSARAIHRLDLPERIASLALTRSLKLVSVGDGIQTLADWELLRELGRDVVQGYYIARPTSDERLETWPAQWAVRES